MNEKYLLVEVNPENEEDKKLASDFNLAVRNGDYNTFKIMLPIISARPELMVDALIIARGGSSTYMFDKILPYMTHDLKLLNTAFYFAKIDMIYGNEYYFKKMVPYMIPEQYLINVGHEEDRYIEAFLYSGAIKDVSSAHEACSSKPGCSQKFIKEMQAYIDKETPYYIKMLNTFKDNIHAFSQDFINTVKKNNQPHPTQDFINTLEDNLDDFTQSYNDEKNYINILHTSQENFTNEF